MDPYEPCWWCGHLWSSHRSREATSAMLPCVEKECICEHFMRKPATRPAPGAQVPDRSAADLRRERIATLIIAGIAASPHEPRWTAASEKLPDKLKELQHRAAMQALVYADALIALLDSGR